MIDIEIIKYLNDNLDVDVFHHRAKDNSESPFVIFNVAPVAQQNIHSGCAVKYNNILTIEVWGKWKKELQLRELVAKIDSVIADFNRKSINDYHIISCCAIKQWEFITLEHTEDVIWQRQYSLTYS